MFSFSKNECEKLALRMKNLDLLDKNEKSLVEGVFNSAVELLSSEDAKCVAHFVQDHACKHPAQPKSL